MKQSVAVGKTGERSALNIACVQTPSKQIQAGKGTFVYRPVTLNTKDSKAWFSFKSLASKAFWLKKIPFVNSGAPRARSLA